MTRSEQNFKDLCEFIDSKNILEDYLKNYISEIDEDTDFDDITEILREANAFDVEVLYCSTAMKFLSEYDASLTESLEIAKEYGYEIENLNSELLASLLKSRMLENDWYENQSEIEDFLSELEWDDDEEVDEVEVDELKMVGDK